MKDFGGPVRNRYFDGKFLTTRDFQTEQAYYIEKRKQHNRFLHGWGVVNGLGVVIQNGRLIVEPGLALDCAGNEVALDSGAHIDFPDGLTDFFIVIEYVEKNVSPLPAFRGEEPIEGKNLEYSRIQEGVRVGAVATDPLKKHDGMGPGTSGCGNTHPISIAHIRKGKTSWKVKNRGRRG